MTRLAEAARGRVEAQRPAVALLGVGTAAPAGVPQEVGAAFAQTLSCRTDVQRGWLARVFRGSGIASRGTVLVRAGEEPLTALRAFYPLPADESDRGPTTAARMTRYEGEAPALAEVAAGRALADASEAAGAITHLVTASCTGFFALGLDAALIARLGLRRDVKRVHVGFMGCHAAFNALGAARDAVRATPGARVLVCCVELCSLHYGYGWETGRVVANALFADGAGAVVMGEAAGAAVGWRLRDAASFLMPGCADAMTWRIGDHGFEMTLAPEVPALVRMHLRGWCETWLARHGLGLGDVASWAIHPGGPKVLTAAAEALGLDESAVAHSRAVLAEHGNMSSATVLFILERMGRAGCAGPCVAIGLGPGLMAEGMLLER